MDLDLSNYQELMLESFAGFLAKEAQRPTARAAIDGPGHDEALWSRFKDLGGHVLSLPEGDLGGGGTFVDAVLVAREVGRVLAPIPYAETVCALRLLTRTGAGDDLLGRVGTGTSALLASGRGDVTVTGRGDAAVASGNCGVLAVAAVADVVVLGIDEGTVAVIDLEQPAVRRRPIQNLGRLPLATVELREAQVIPCPSSEEAVAHARCELRILRAAVIVGAGRASLDLVLGHVRDRQQFGRPIGSFQAIQHRLADCATAIDAAELLTLRAASAAEGIDRGRLRRDSAAALVETAQAAEHAATEALQFFGGYGFTLEYEIHRYLRFVKSAGVVARDEAMIFDDLLLGLDTPGHANKTGGDR